MSTTAFSAPPPETEAPPGFRASKVPRRRRAWMVAAAVGLFAVSIGGNMSLIAAANAREPMLVLAHDVDWGHHLTTHDLSTVELNPEASRFAIPESQRGQVVGRIARDHLAAGQILTAGSLSTQAIPGPGQQVVAIKAEPGHVPASGIDPNDPVEIAAATDNTTATADPLLEAESRFSGRAVRVGPPDADGAVTVDVLIPDTAADQAHGAAAEGGVITLLGPGH